MSLVIPSSMREAVVFFLGETGADAWLDALPTKVERFRQLWSLDTREILPGGVMSCCIRCQDGSGEACVLKIPLDAQGGALEGAALAAWSHSGGVPAVKKLDTNTGTILMSYIEPGTSRIRPQEAIVDLLDRLHGPDTRVLGSLGSFPGLQTNVDLRIKWATDRFAIPEYGEGLQFIDGAIRRAERLLHDEQQEPQLLHGDLQAKNLLLNTSGQLMAIDPLPVYGDVHYDAAFWCVMDETGESIEHNLAYVADQVPVVEYQRLCDWAQALAAIELRPYLPHPRARMLAFLEG